MKSNSTKESYEAVTLAMSTMDSNDHEYLENGEAYCVD